MKSTWSNKLKWEGFRPTAYTLDAKRVWELPIDRTTKNLVGEGDAPTHTTLGEVFVQLTKEQIGEIKEMFGLTVETGSGEHRFSGSSFSMRMLGALLRLHKVGANGFDAYWYWYDSDSVTDDPHDSYAFFVVCGDRIVEERMSFSDYPDSGFDPSVFSLNNGGEHIWFRDDDWREAGARFWYRKFYTETRTGQLMVLRPDEPELYFYPEGRLAWTSPFVVAGLQSRLQKIHRLLVALVVIGILVLVFLWR